MINMNFDLEKGTENELLPIYNFSAIEEKLKIHELQEKLLSTDKRNLHTQIAITKQIEQIKWITKEKVGTTIEVNQILYSSQ